VLTDGHAAALHSDALADLDCGARDAANRTRNTLTRRSLTLDWRRSHGVEPSDFALGARAATAR
jgi:hypothetical protein